jgi:hypothetical protein
MNAAETKRFEGIRNVCIASQKQVKCEDGGYVNRFLATREEMATAIRSLVKLGRTERWTASIENWATMVETEESLEWAFAQGSIWASHAVD